MADSTVILRGTGITQSIIAASLARYNVDVLHTDENAQYGGCHRTLSLQELADLPEINKSRSSTKEEVNAHASDSRFYCLDLSPKIVACDGPLVRLLVESGVSRYLEFKLLQGTYVFSDKRLEKVPCTKEDIFRNSSLSLVEKRKLMKLINELQQQRKEDNDDKEKVLAGLDHNKNEEVSFAEYLESKIGAKWASILLFAVADVTSQEMELSVKEGVAKFQHYHACLSKFGPSPYLVVMYGISEIPQAFCRAAAVYGATYKLAHNIEKENKNVEDKTQRKIARQIWITEKSIAGTDAGDEQVRVLLPPRSVLTSQTQLIHILQLSSEVAMCPKDKYIVHASMEIEAGTTETSALDLLQEVCELALIFKPILQFAFVTPFDSDEGGAALPIDHANVVEEAQKVAHFHLGDKLDALIPPLSEIDAD